MTGLTLRPYQLEAIARTEAAEARGVRRQLGVAATGLGKTVVFTALAERRPGRTLILAHRDELIRQAVAKVRETWPGCPSIGVVKAAENDIGARVVVASVQTLGRPRRLARLGPPHGEPDDGLWPSMVRQGFDLVVVDEAHHAAAPTYRRILEHVGAGKPDGPLLLGVTATPDRGDGVGLDGTFDEITWSYDTLWGIRAGFLSDVVGRRVELAGLDVAQIATSRGDYQLGAAGAALEGAGAPAAIARSLVDFAPGRRALAFLPTVATAVHTAEACTRLGLRAEWVSGELDGASRRSILRAFGRGDLDVVANCAVLTEGYDNPAVDCVVVGRPTKSRALYAQMIGRGTRRHPDKSNCLVLDLVGASAEHSLVTLPTLFGLPVGKMRQRAASGRERLSELAAEHEEHEIKAGRLRAEDVELFHQVRAGDLAWVDATVDTDDRRRYVLQVAKGENLVMAQLDRADPESWAVQLQHGEKGNATLIRGVSMETAQGVGEDYARAHAPRAFVDRAAAWRSRPPRPSQLQAARRMGIRKPGQYATAGELSDVMTATRVRKAAERRRRQTATDGT